MAPHARAPISLARIQTIRLIALAPVLIAAVINTGYQYLSALSAIGGLGSGDWRDRVVRSLGLDYSDPTIFAVLAAGLVHLLPVLAMALLVGGVWEQLFASYRRRQRESGLLVIAVLMTLLMPPGVSLVHLAVGMSFGMVFGKCIFGGEGKTIRQSGSGGCSRDADQLPHCADRSSFVERNRRLRWQQSAGPVSPTGK